MFARTLLASAIAALALAGSTVDANGYNHGNKTHYKGFNTGSTFNNYTNKYQADYEAEFLNAKALQGGNGTFTSQRLYTMIQAGTQYDPIEAIPAAIATNTTLLLGLWASQNQDGFNLELAALNVAIETYGQKFLDLVVGISVGSEDLYRITPTGIENLSGVGQSPDVLVQYITEVRGVLANNNLYNISVGHVDTWTAWVNNSNAAVIDACDFIGYDGYPYFEVSLDNTIEHGYTQFWTSYNATVAAVQARGGNQTVWVTETGWPLSGPTANAAVASTQNAEIYWQAVACELFRKNINTWWFTMWDSDPNVPSPSFGLVGQYLQPQPLINLTCAY